MSGTDDVIQSLRLEFSGERAAPIVMRAKGLNDMIANQALKCMQVGTQERRHDAGEHHLSLTLRTGRTLNCNERNDGQQGVSFWHHAPSEQA